MTLNTLFSVVFDITFIILKNYSKAWDTTRVLIYKMTPSKLIKSLKFDHLKFLEISWPTLCDMKGTKGQRSLLVKDPFGIRRSSKYRSPKARVDLIVRLHHLRYLVSFTFGVMHHHNYLWYIAFLINLGQN